MNERQQKIADEINLFLDCIGAPTELGMEANLYYIDSKSVYGCGEFELVVKIGDFTGSYKFLPVEMTYAQKKFAFKKACQAAFWSGVEEAFEWPKE